MKKVVSDTLEDKCDLFELYYYLSGLKSLSLSEAYIATQKKDALPRIGGIIADAIYGKNEPDSSFINEKKWRYYKALTASSDKFGSDDCLDLSINFYQNKSFKEACFWLNRACVIFNKKEAAFFIAHMYENGEYFNKNLIHSAKWYLKASSMPEPYHEVYFDLSTLPAKDGIWTDMTLLNQWITEIDPTSVDLLLSVTNTHEVKKFKP